MPTPSCCRWAIRGSASHPSTFRTCSRNFSACRDKAAEREPVWDWRSSMKSSPPMGERSPARAGPERERPSTSACRCRPKVSNRGTCSAIWRRPVPVDDSRPAPEHFLTLIRQQQRGRLKIYLGFAAGVGKTYEMLQEGHRLKRRGVDVVIGLVESHGRAETIALIGDLEQVPRRQIEFHGVTLEEMDLDAILARRPSIALVDELAHTNAPGSRNAKRYQDVDELLQVGINVISTLNIQHLESLYDMVERAIGVKVKERVPDYVLGMADQLVNVDVSAEDLRERLQAGKVYPLERIDTALQNFFTQVNLTRLRELALEEIAHRLDRRRTRHDADESPGGSTTRWS